MKRVIIICEGQTEQEFCKKNLHLHLQAKGILIQTPLIKHSRGGIVQWSVLKQQIETHLKSEPNAYVTTFIDYYGLHSKYNFPNWDECEKIEDCNERMDFLENAMHLDVLEKLRFRFIPYLQLHEFEGLLFSNIGVFYSQFSNKEIVGEDELLEIFANYDNPELINNTKETSPSHRLKRIIRGYDKVVYGNVLAEAIGLERIREKSPRFNCWISKIESLNSTL